MFDRLKKLFGNDAAVAPEPPPANATGAEPVATNFLCREAVFDRGNRLAGHLFRVQHASPTASSPPGLQRCFDETLLAALNGSQEAWNTSLAFLPLSSSSLFLPAIDRLKTSNLYLLVNLAADLDSDALCARMNELRNRGLSILLFRQPTHPAFAAAMACSDGGAIDLAHSEPGAVRDFSAAVRAMEKSSPLELFATGIDTLDEHHLCHQWHFAFFHGRFAETHLPTREASGGDPHKVLLLNILRLVQGEAETAEIAEAMKQDPLLAFRILRYLNSPALGLRHRIDSLAQALVILGRQRMARWLSVLLFSVREPNFGDWLMVEGALTRGRLMEELGKRLMPGQATDPLFLTGIFSSLDRLLRRPLAEILDDMPLADDVRAALLERSGPYAPLLAVAEAGEDYNLPRMEETAKAAGLDPADVNHALLAATAWASEVTEHWE